MSKHYIVLMQENLCKRLENICMENIFISNFLLFYMNTFWQEELQVILQCVTVPIYYNW